jgi:protein SCO1/2
MAGKNRRDVLTMLGVGGAAVLAGGVAAGAPGRAAADAEDDSRARTQERYLPNVELLTHEGRKVRFYDDLVKNKIVLINFMYAECTGICPGITANLQRVQKLLGDRVGRDIFMYSVTLTPEKDTPRKLWEYVKMHRIEPGWTFLTGKPDDVELLRRRLGFYTSNQKNDKDKTNHTGMVRYGNEPRQWWGMCPGQAKPEWIVETIHWMDGPKPQQPKANATE